MNLYLEELSKEFPEEKLLLIMDGAGWHKSKELIIPNNIEIIYLPPYSPELNPVERLWLYIKQSVLRNRIYDSILELEESVTNFIRSISNDTIAQICTANYLFS